MATPNKLNRVPTSLEIRALSGRTDDFELARHRAENGFLLLTDGDTFKFAGILQNEEASPAQKEAAYTYLSRNLAPLALQAAVKEADKFSSFAAAHSAADIALWKVVSRWDPKKGMKLSFFVQSTLPVELERERKEAEAVSRTEWIHIAVKTAMNEITENGYNKLYMTAYSDAQGDTVTLKARTAGTPPTLTLAFPDTTTVTRTAGITVRVPPEKFEGSNGQTLPNLLLSWLNHRKANVSKTFNPRTRNWPRITARAKTGYKLTEIQSFGHEFSKSTLGTKLTSRLMQSRIFARPPRPIRQEDVTPRMVQDVMKQNRKLKNMPFDEKAWSLARIADIMYDLHTVTSYNAVITDSEGDTTQLLEFIAAPEQDDDVIPEDEFDTEELSDASRIAEHLMKSGLWELALSIPLKKFLTAHRAGHPGFCTLCSRYGIRVKHALSIVKAIEATLR